MKLIKNINEEIPKLNMVGAYIRKKDDDYVLENTEELVYNSEYIESCQLYNIIDYRQKRSVYKYFAQNFTGQTNDVKDKICYYCATTPEIIIPYYMSKGMSYEESLNIYKENRALDIKNACDNYKFVMTSDNATKVMVKYLPQNELQRFVDETFKLAYLYGNYGIWGKKYSDYVDGIMDFIEDYGTFEGKGLSTYTLNEGTTLQDFIEELKILLIL